MLKRKRRHKLGTSNTDPARFNKSQIKIYGYLIPISIVMLLPIIYIIIDFLFLNLSIIILERKNKLSIIKGDK